MNLKIARVLAIMAYIAYPRQSHHEKLLKGVFNITRFKSMYMDGYIATNDEDTVLCFAGTDELTDVLVDLKVWKQEYDGVKVHAGFFESMITVWPYIEDVIQTVKHRTIWLTGHSMGGAVSILAAKKLKQLGFSPIVYTFGSPRAVAKGSEWAFNFPIERFINDGDLVPLYPPFIRTYVHVGNLHYVYENLKIKRPSLISKWKDEVKLSWRLILLGSCKFLRGIIKYHSILTYIERLEKKTAPALLQERQ